jgi:hypothetical protein
MLLRVGILPWLLLKVKARSTESDAFLADKEKFFFVTALGVVGSALMMVVGDPFYSTFFSSFFLSFSDESARCWVSSLVFSVICLAS